MPNKLREIFSTPDDVTFEFDLDLTPEGFEHAMKTIEEGALFGILQREENGKHYLVITYRGNLFAICEIARHASVEEMNYILDYLSTELGDSLDNAILYGVKMMTDLTELNKLEKYLKQNGIQYERIDSEKTYDANGMLIKLERHQIFVPCEDESEWDAICQPGSYGYEEGLLEIYGSLVTEEDGDSVVGHMTAEEVIKRIEKEKITNGKE